MTNGNIAERSHQQPWKWNAVLNIKPSKSKHSHASALQKGNCLCMPLSFSCSLQLFSPCSPPPCLSCSIPEKLQLIMQHPGLLSDTGHRESPSLHLFLTTVIVHQRGWQNYFPLACSHRLCESRLSRQRGTWVSNSNRHLCSNKHLWLNLSLVITPFIWIFFTWIQESWKQCCSRYNFQALQFGALFSSQLFPFNWKRNINPAAQSK